MKSLKIIAVWCIAVLLITALDPTSFADVYSSVIRLHVLAESDSPEDQSLKLSVRDKVLEFISVEFEGVPDIEKAKEKILLLKDEIQKIAEEEISANGFDYPVSVEFGEEFYPTRTYGTLSFPTGKYLSLRIVIGHGQGKNWWCVLFPPVCTESATEPCKVLEEGGIDEKDVKLITLDGKKYELRFRFLEFINSVIAK